MSGNPAAGPRVAPLTLAIGVSMTIGYGTLYYPFAILGPEIARDLGWTNSFVFGVFSFALLSSAHTASVAGRMIDRYGARPVMMAGSICAALSLVALSRVGAWPAFIAAMLMIEVSGRMAQYEAGFAALTAIHGQEARRHITHVTLIAGFASTVFWPLIHWLLSVMDWRGVCLVLAAINLLIAFPIHALIPRLPSGSEPEQPAADSAAPTEGTTQLTRLAATGLLPEPERTRVFALMAVAFACGGFLMSAVHSSFFVILDLMGRDAALAALAGAIIGPMQVGARVVELLTGGKVASSLVGVISNATMLGGILLLVAATGLPGSGLIIAFAASFGIGQGLAFIARAVLPARLFGTDGYGRVTGNLAAVRLLFTAAAPFLTALVIAQAGLSAAFALLIAMAVMGVAASLLLWWAEHRAGRQSANPPT